MCMTILGKPSFLDHHALDTIIWAGTSYSMEGRNPFMCLFISLLCAWIFASAVLWWQKSWKGETAMVDLDNFSPTKPNIGPPAINCGLPGGWQSDTWLQVYQSSDGLHAEHGGSPRTWWIPGMAIWSRVFVQVFDGYTSVMEYLLCMQSFQVQSPPSLVRCALCFLATRRGRQIRGWWGNELELGETMFATQLLVIFVIN